MNFDPKKPDPENRDLVKTNRELYSAYVEMLKLFEILGESRVDKIKGQESFIEVRKHMHEF